MQPTIKQVDKDHYELKINEINVGTLERSEVRYLIQELDNAI